MVKFYLLVVISATAFYAYVTGHGMVLDPVNRASRWRYDTKAKANYDDTQGWCGGFYVRAFCISLRKASLFSGVLWRKNILNFPTQFLLVQETNSLKF